MNWSKVGVGLRARGRLRAKAYVMNWSKVTRLGIGAGSGLRAGA